MINALIILLFGVLFAALNRWRGTYGWFAKVLGLVLFAVTYFASGSLLIAALIGVGYWLGELLCGWGDHVGNTTVKRLKVFAKFPDDGDAVGVRWLTSVIVYPQLWKLHVKNAKKGLWNWYPKIVNTEIKGYSIAKLIKIDVQKKEIETFIIDKALTYSRVYLVVRGFAWWLLPMAGVSLWIGSWLHGLVGLAVVSFGFPLCAELAYVLRDKIAFQKFGLSFIGGWEHQEVFNGFLVGLVIGTLFLL